MEFVEIVFLKSLYATKPTMNKFLLLQMLGANDTNLGLIKKNFRNQRQEWTY
jgi:hypothetical protein